LSGRNVQSGAKAKAVHAKLYQMAMEAFAQGLALEAEDKKPN